MFKSPGIRFYTPKGLFLSDIWARRLRPATARYPAHFSQKNNNNGHRCLFGKRLSSLCHGSYLWKWHDPNKRHVPNSSHVASIQHWRVTHSLHSGVAPPWNRDRADTNLPQQSEGLPDSWEGGPEYKKVCHNRLQILHHIRRRLPLQPAPLWSPKQQCQPASPDGPSRPLDQTQPLCSKNSVSACGGKPYRCLKGGDIPEVSCSYPLHKPHPADCYVILWNFLLLTCRRTNAKEALNYLNNSGVRLATEDPDMVDMITDVAGGLLIKDYESGC